MRQRILGSGKLQIFGYTEGGAEEGVTAPSSPSSGAFCHLSFQPNELSP